MTGDLQLRKYTQGNIGNTCGNNEDDDYLKSTYFVHYKKWFFIRASQARCIVLQQRLHTLGSRNICMLKQQP